MLRITLYLDDTGCLKGISAHGHSGLADKGKDILCAAVSTILRTTARLVHANRGIVSSGLSPGPGEMELRLASWQPEETDWIRGITDFCSLGLSDLHDEYPERIIVREIRGEAPVIRTEN